MEAMEIAINEATSPSVKIWMNWMLLVFAASIIFVWKYKAARIVLVSFILTIAIALIVFNVSNSAHLIGIAHILLWGPLAFYLLRFEIKSQTFQIKSVYGVWIILLLVTIAISLLFDVRDIILVFMGAK